MRGIKAEHHLTSPVRRVEFDRFRKLALPAVAIGEQLPDLIWLAGHGCEARPELGEAVALVNAYQDSPGRAEMLAELTRLREKP